MEINIRGFPGLKNVGYDFYWLQHMFDAYSAQMYDKKLLPSTIMDRAEGLARTDLGVRVR